MKTIKATPLFLSLYYIILLLLETPIIGQVGVPPIYLRILYIIAVIVPIWLYNRAFLPIVVFATYTVSKFGTAVTLMPTEVWYYIPILLVGLVPLKKKKKTHSRNLMLFIIIFTIYILFIDLANSQSVHNIFYCFFILFLFFIYFYLPCNHPFSFINMMSYMFICISIIISFEILFADQRFVTSYGSTGLDRTLWVDPNYLGCVIGMGLMSAVAMLYREGGNLGKKVGLLVICSLIFIALAINSSRGALLAVILGLGVFLIRGNVKIWKKSIIILLGAFFVFWMYNSGYFDLIEYRIQNDTGGGSGRIDIWKTKLDYYLNDSSPLEFIFGRGYENGYVLGQKDIHRDTTAFHNDFLAFLIDYGLVGFLAFLSFFILPLRQNRRRDTIILANMMYLFVCCMTLEPFSLGMLLYFIFWGYNLLQTINVKDKYLK